MHYERDFTIGVKDVKYFHQELMLEKRGKVIIAGGVVGAIAAWLCLNWMNQQPGTLGELVVMAFAGLASAEIITLGMLFSNSRNVKGRMRRMGKTSYIQRVEIDGFGVHVEADGRKGKAGFDKLVRVKETTRAFYLFLSKDQAWILPKDQMEDEAAETRQLRELFTAVIASGQLKLLK